MKTILLVEDDLTLLRALKRAIETSSYHVITAESGSEALRYCSVLPIDLVVTDIIMPDGDGLDLLRRLRSQSRVLPIIAISGGARIRAEDCLKMASRLG